MSNEILSGPLPISGHRKPPFDVPGQPKLEFPFIRAGYWEAERRKFKAPTNELPKQERASKAALPRAPKPEGLF